MTEGIKTANMLHVMLEEKALKQEHTCGMYIRLASRLH